MQFFERLLFGLRRHPRQPLDVALHGLFDLPHHFLGALLGLRRERPLHISLAQGLSQIIVCVADAALPARFELLGSSQSLAEEIKVGIHKRRGQVGRIRMHQMPAQVCLPAFQIFFLKNRIHGLEEFRRDHIQRTQPGLTGSGEILLPPESRAERLQFLARHLVIKQFGITTLHLSQRSVGQRCLNPHHR